jgi:hypothetical protein
MILLFVTIILALTTGFYFLEKMPSFQEFWNGYSDQIQDSPVVWFCDSLDLVLGTAGMILMVMVFKEQ